MESKTLKLDKMQFGVFVLLLKGFLEVFNAKDQLETCVVLLLHKLLKNCAKKLLDNKEKYRLDLKPHVVMAVSWMLNKIDVIDLDPYCLTVYMYLYETLEAREGIVKFSTNASN